MNHPKFNIGDKVYHNTPNSEECIILDIHYSYLNKRHTYVVSIGFGEEFVCKEFELTEDKIF